MAIRDDGTIGVTYYDWRNNSVDPNTIPTDYWLVTSTDGINWSERHVAGPFDYRLAPQASGALFLGDYMGLATLGTSFVPAFGVTTGSVTTNRADINAALLRPVPPATAAAATPVKTERAPSQPATADFLERVGRNIRAALARRLPAPRGAGTAARIVIPRTALRNFPQRRCRFDPSRFDVPGGTVQPSTACAGQTNSVTPSTG